MEGIALNTLENIELVMPEIRKMLESGEERVGPRVLAPLAEAIVTLARELRELRDRRP
jgi:hypothetical protein